MNKTITLQLTEAQYRELKLCYTLGELVKDSIEEKSKTAMQSQMEMSQLLDKAAYEAKLKGSSFEDGIYEYGKDIEEEMLELYEKFREYIESGAAAAEDEQIRRQLE